MVLRISQLLVVAFAALATLAAPSFAQDDPGEVVRRAAAAMDRVAAATVDRIGERTGNGIQLIQRLDANGASDREIVQAGRRAIGAVNQAGNHGARHINLLASRAANILRRLEADRSFFRALNAARDGSTEDVRSAQRRGVNAIQSAVEDALDG